MPTFAEKLQEVRKERDFTQDRLSKEMNVSRQTISHWENGRAVPDIDTIKHLSQVLDYNFLAVEGTTEETQIAPEAEEIPPQPEEESAQEIAVQQTESTPRKKRFVLLAVLGAVLLCAVLIVCLLMNDKPSGEPANLYEPYTREWYQQEQTPVAGQAFVRIKARENPVYAVKDESVPDGAMWFYEFQIQEQNGIAFTIEEAVLTTFRTNGTTAREVFTSDEITGFFGTCVLDDDHTIPWGGGFPIQNVSGMGMLITGTDEKGNHLEFHGYVELLQEIREN